jgi:hypothetical protein
MNLIRIRFILFSEIIAAYCDNHINKLCAVHGQNSYFGFLFVSRHCQYFSVYGVAGMIIGDL